MKTISIVLLSCLLGACLHPVQAQIFQEVGTDVISGISAAGNFRGCAWVDLDQDGDLDLSIAGSQAVYIYENGSFTKVDAPGLFAGTRGSVSWGDYDNDGDYDCLFGGASDTRIYRNNGDLSFTNVDIDPTQSLATWSASWGEWDNDGNLDAVMAVAFGFGPTTASFFYQGSSSGSFTEIDTFQFSNQTAPYTIANWIDFDDDQDLDLFFASGPGVGTAGPDYVFKNLFTETGTAGWQRITNLPFTAENQDGQCYNFVDADLDGDRDMYLTNWVAAPNRYYEREEDGSYTSLSNNLVFGGAYLSNAWGDIDNDGDEDVIITAGFPSLASAGIFRNDGNHQFTKIENPFSGAPGPVSGISLGDYDGDGYLDFFVVGGTTSATPALNKLYRNTSANEKHWIQFDLAGGPSNRAAIGARIKLRAEIQGEMRWLDREISAQNTFMGHNALRVHFGLDEATQVDSLYINWPSGFTQSLSNLSVDSLYQIEELGITNVNGRSSLEFISPLGVFPNPAKNTCTVELPAEVEQTRGHLAIIDESGKDIHLYKVNTHAFELPMYRLTAGTYTLVWRTEEGNYRGRLVKM